jgi:hypothetical protein
MYYLFIVLWFVFLVAVIQMRHHWKTFNTLKSRTLSSLSSKTSESLINSTYYSFLTLFTNYFLHKIMSRIMFTLCIISYNLRLRI